jgi:hypothetical protein
MTNEVSAGPLRPPVDREKAKTAAKSALHRAVWEASQFMALTDIERYVAGTLEEIRSDEP